MEEHLVKRSWRRRVGVREDQGSETTAEIASMTNPTVQGLGGGSQCPADAEEELEVEVVAREGVRRVSGERRVAHRLGIRTPSIAPGTTNEWEAGSGGTSLKKHRSLEVFESKRSSCVGSDSLLSPPPPPPVVLDVEGLLLLLLLLEVAGGGVKGS